LQDNTLAPLTPVSEKSSEVALDVPPVMGCDVDRMVTRRLTRMPVAVDVSSGTEVSR